MRVAVLSPFVDRRHGTERALAELLERLARDFGHEIHLYSQMVQDLALGAAPSVTAGQPGTILWHKVPTIAGPHLLQFVFWLVANRLKRIVDRVFRGIRPDLVLSPGINAGDASVILVHAVFHRLAELQELQPVKGFRSLHRSFYYRLLCLLEDRLYRKQGTSLVAVSRRTAAQIKYYFDRDDVTVIPNAVNTSDFSPAMRESRRCAVRELYQLSAEHVALLLVGNDWNNKGLPTLLKAMVICRDPRLRLFVVGYDEPKTFRELAAREGIADSIKFTGNSPEIRDFYAAADVYVAPSLEDSFNMPALEAMACGLPVIVSTNAGISEHISDGENGLILREAGDSEELAELIRQLAKDHVVRERLGKAAAKTAQSLTWDDNARRVNEVLKRALKRSG